MTAERTSPERTAGLRRVLERGCLEDASWQPPCSKCGGEALAALDELVAALAAETRLRIADAARAAKEKSRADALAARLEQVNAEIARLKGEA